MNRYAYVLLTVVTIAMISSGNNVTNAFSCSDAYDGVSYCPPICLDGSKSR